MDVDYATMTLGKLIREHPEYVEKRIRYLLDERKMIKKGLDIARSDFLYIARCSVENQDMASYAIQASRNLPVITIPSEEGKKV